LDVALPITGRVGGAFVAEADQKSSRWSGKNSIWEPDREAGSSVLALDTDSSDLEEVLGVSNRIMVMAHGKQAGILDRKDANDVSVMELATS
jgi:hypothetical protein